MSEEQPLKENQTPEGQMQEPDQTDWHNMSRPETKSGVPPSPPDTSATPPDTPPQYVTLEQFNELKAMLERQPQTAEPAEDPLSQEALDRTYNETFGSPPNGTPEEVDDPLARDMAQMKRQLFETQQLLKTQKARSDQQAAIGRMVKKYPDWKEYEKDAIALASGRTPLADDDWYLLAKARRDPSLLTKVEREKVEKVAQALEAGKEASQAATQKPASEGTNAKPAAQNVVDAAAQAWDALPPGEKYQ